MNVPTDYVLRNNEVLKPKSQVAVNGIKEGTSVYENGVEVISEIQNASASFERQAKSAGKDEEITVRKSPSAGIQLKITDITTGDLINAVAIGIPTVQDDDTPDNYKIVEYIGQPFLSDSDTDRYAIITAYDTNWKLCLYNIDTNTIQKRWDGDSEIYYDYTYDGAYTIYFIYKGNNDIYSKDIRGATGGSITPLKDTDDNRITAEYIYGMVNDVLVFKGTDTNVKNYTISTQVLAQTTTTIENFIFTPEGKGILCFTDGAMFYFSNVLNSANSKILTQSLVDGNIISPGEVGLVPTTINNFEETATEIIITWTMFRNTNDILTLVTTTITKADNNIVSSSFNAGSVYGEVKSTNFLRNQVNNVKNGYYYDGTISKFYKYGLQVQSDSI